jgi:Membrane proteins related to metalloendopeptidases
MMNSRDKIHWIWQQLKVTLKGEALWIKNIFSKFFNRKESFTLMFIPHTPVKSVKSLKFSKWIISSFVVLNIIMFGAACIFILSYHSLNAKLKNKKLEYETLQAMKENDEKQINEYKSNETMINEKMQQLEELENKMKQMIENTGSVSQSDSISSSLASRSGRSTRYIQPQSEKITGFESYTQMYSAIDDLIENVDSTIEELNDASRKAEAAAKAIMSKPSVLPTYGHITSLYGYRKNPFGGGYEFHSGIDISNKKGTPIKASGDGMVIWADWKSGYGYLIEIDHENGYKSLYGHNSKIVVQVGQYVKRGQLIGYMGSTGESTGNHCHFEVQLNGKSINPYSVR